MGGEMVLTVSNSCVGVTSWCLTLISAEYRVKGSLVVWVFQDWDGLKEYKVKD